MDVCVVVWTAILGVVVGDMSGTGRYGVYCNSDAYPATSIEPVDVLDQTCQLYRICSSVSLSAGPGTECHCNNQFVRGLLTLDSTLLGHGAVIAQQQLMIEARVCPNSTTSLDRYYFSTARPLIVFALSTVFLSVSTVSNGAAAYIVNLGPLNQNASSFLDDFVAGISLPPEQYTRVSKSLGIVALSKYDALVALAGSRNDSAVVGAGGLFLEYQVVDPHLLFLLYSASAPGGSGGVDSGTSDCARFAGDVCQRLFSVITFQTPLSSCPLLAIDICLKLSLSYNIGMTVNAAVDPQFYMIGFFVLLCVVCSACGCVGAYWLYKFRTSTVPCLSH